MNAVKNGTDRQGLCRLYRALLVLTVGISTFCGVAIADVRHVKVGNEVFLENNFMSIGISGSGSYGTSGSAPAGFHPLGARTILGLSADHDGFDQGNAPVTGDWFLPGSPEEGFTVGYRKTSVVGPISRFTNAERRGVIQIARESVADFSSDDAIQARWVGTASGGDLKVTQFVQAREEHEFFLTTITLENTSSQTLYSVRYMRSFDPDQDADFNSNYSTTNTVSDQFPADSRAVVLAYGPVTGLPILLATFDSRGRVSNFGFANRDPYESLAYDSPRPKGWSQYSDSAITITFDVGALAPGESKSVRFITSIDEDFSAALSYIESLTGIPTDIQLSENEILNHESIGTPVGELSATDDIGDLHTFDLISGIGDTDNALFSIEGNVLKSAAVFEPHTGRMFNIRVRVADIHGNTYEEILIVNLIDKHIPTVFRFH